MTPSIPINVLATTTTIPASIQPLTSAQVKMATDEFSLGFFLSGNPDQTKELREDFDKLQADFTNLKN